MRLKNYSYFLQFKLDFGLKIMISSIINLWKFRFWFQKIMIFNIDFWKIKFLHYSLNYICTVYPKIMIWKSQFWPILFLKSWFNKSLIFGLTIWANQDKYLASSDSKMLNGAEYRTNNLPSSGCVSLIHLSCPISSSATRSKPEKMNGRILIHFVFIFNRPK